MCPLLVYWITINPLQKFCQYVKAKMHKNFRVLFFSYSCMSDIPNFEMILFEVDLFMVSLQNLFQALEITFQFKISSENSLSIQRLFSLSSEGNVIV